MRTIANRQLEKPGARGIQTGSFVRRPLWVESGHCLDFCGSAAAMIFFNSAFVSGSDVSTLARTISSTLACCLAFADTDHFAALPISTAPTLPLLLANFI